jgi:hypothetical protein
MIAGMHKFPGSFGYKSVTSYETVLVPSNVLASFDMREIKGVYEYRAVVIDRVTSALNENWLSS